MESIRPSFAYLFRKYRLLSGLATLDEFANKLAEEGIYLESSVFSHWQIGDRIPTSRSLALRIVKIFVKQKGIKTIEEANELLAAADFGYLTNHESKELFSEKHKEFSVEEKIKRIQAVDTLSSYYLHFLKQAKRGNFSYYPEIEKERISILKVLNQCFEYKFYDKYLQIWNYVSPFFWDRGYWDDFEQLSKKAFGIAGIIDNKQEQARILVKDLSWLYYWRGNIEKEEKILQQGQGILDKKRDSYLDSVLSLRKGLICKNKNRFEDAKAFLNKAHKYFISINNIDFISKSALYLGHLFQAQNNFDKAKTFYESSLKYGKLTKNENEPKALYYLGEISFKTKQTLKAKNYFEQALKIDKQYQRTGGYGWNYHGLALCSKGNQQKNLANTAAKFFSSLKMNDQARKSLLLADKKEGEPLF